MCHLSVRQIKLFLVKEIQLEFQINFKHFIPQPWKQHIEIRVFQGFSAPVQALLSNLCDQR